jgi:exosortase B
MPEPGRWSALPSLLGIGPTVLALAALVSLSTQVWLNEEQSHGPVVLVVALWLAWQRRGQLVALPPRPWPMAGWTLLAAAFGSFAVGRSQQVIQLEVLSPMLAGLGVLGLWRGPAAWRALLLPLILLLLAVPLPGVLVQTLTLPLKIAVSQVAEWLLHAAGYPVARSGVVLAVDQYQLLVADACAGLTSMFTLEAMGLAYIRLRGHASALRQGLLALLIVPISLAANVVRVLVLVAVTYHLGDAAGRGFLHSAAGVLLFAVATLLMLATDALLGRWLPGSPVAAPLARATPAAPRHGGAAAGSPAAPGPLATGLATLLLLLALPAAQALRPVHRSADGKGAIVLAQQVPPEFGGWREDRSVLPLLPDPGLQATLDATYSQVLARTYIDDQRRRVMLSIAYGNDQSADATAVHRPEFCYRGQGFDVQVLGRSRLQLPDQSVTLQRLVGRLDRRVEAISYWVTLDETATLPGLDRKLQQLRHGLHGVIADGMLVRVSTLGAADDAAFALQARFLVDLYQALPARLRGRYFGAAGRGARS